MGDSPRVGWHGASLGYASSATSKTMLLTERAGDIGATAIITMLVSSTVIFSFKSSIPPTGFGWRYDRPGLRASSRSVYARSRDLRERREGDSHTQRPARGCRREERVRWCRRGRAARGIQTLVRKAARICERPARDPAHRRDPCASGPLHVGVVSGSPYPSVPPFATVAFAAQA